MITPLPTPAADETLYREIIVGVDGGAGGRDAACLARVLGLGGRRTLVYVRLYNPPGDHPTMLELDRVDDWTSLRNALEEERRLSGLSGDSAGCERVLADSVAAGLADEATRRSADLIVVGACHRHGLARLLWGDDTRALLRRSPPALALAPRGFSRAPYAPERIGAVAATSATKGALTGARRLAEQFGARLEVRQIDSVTTGPLRRQLDEFAAEVDLLVCPSHRE